MEYFTPRRSKATKMELEEWKCRHRRFDIELNRLQSQRAHRHKWGNGPLPLRHLAPPRSSAREFSRPLFSITQSRWEVQVRYIHWLLSSWVILRASRVHPPHLRSQHSLRTQGQNDLSPCYLRGHAAHFCIGCIEAHSGSWPLAARCQDFIAR